MAVADALLHPALAARPAPCPMPLARQGPAAFAQIPQRQRRRLHPAPTVASAAPRRSKQQGAPAVNSNAAPRPHPVAAAGAVALGEGAPSSTTSTSKQPISNGNGAASTPFPVVAPEDFTLPAGRLSAIDRSSPPAAADAFRCVGCVDPACAGPAGCANLPWRLQPSGYVREVLVAKVYDVAITTPLQRAEALSAALGSTILLKREDLQAVKSFKLRGAYNKMAQLTLQQLQTGVICSSAGNHAQVRGATGQGSDPRLRRRRGLSWFMQGLGFGCRVRGGCCPEHLVASALAAVA